MTTQSKIIGQSLNIGYDNHVLMHDLNFEVKTGEIFAIMGPSGCGKSTLLRVLTGLLPPISGKVIINNADFYGQKGKKRDQIMRQSGVLYQSGALFSSMTLGQNIGLILEQYTDYSPSMIQDLVNFKLSLVGLGGYADFYPSEISGGMKKRAGLARAMALDPQILYLDEPSAGLDPVSSKLLDDLILELNQSLGTTFVFVSHELSSIFSIADNSIYLDKYTKSISATGKPTDILKNPPNERVLSFLTGGKQ